MKIKLSWIEFVDAAMRELGRNGDGDALGAPEFYQTYGYEPDGECYSFPPAYVEIEVTPKVNVAEDDKDATRF